MKPVDIFVALQGKRFPLHDEKALQGAIWTVFQQSFDLGFIMKELALDKDNIIDFFIYDGIGIEVKIKGSKREILRQCTRYCGFRDIKSLILITNLSMGFPRQINGKDCYVFKLGNAWL